MADSRIHKAPKSFYFDFSGAPETATDIIERINKKQYDNLDTFLKSIEWELVGDELIATIDLRHFTKCIADDETRLDVMKFLKKYAKQYFRKAAEDLEYNEHVRVASTVSIVRENVKSADEYLNLFEDELGYLIDQLENSGGFSGDKFKKQQEKIKNLEKQVKELQETNLQLKTRIDELEHPEKRHQVPNELRCEEFYHIMSYLQNSGYVSPRESPVGMYRGPIYYHWNILTPKALFGYFVCKTCYLLELRTKEDHLMWKLFKQAFDNFNKFEKQARDHASKNKNWENVASSVKPDGAHIIDEAFAYCAKQMELSKKRKER